MSHTVAQSLICTPLSKPRPARLSRVYLLHIAMVHFALYQSGAIYDEAERRMKTKYGGVAVIDTQVCGITHILGHTPLVLLNNLYKSKTKQLASHQKDHN